jgi:hypothetical protein
MIGTHERNGPVGLRALVARVKPSTSLDGGSSNPDRPRADCELHDKPFVDSTLAGSQSCTATVRRLHRRTIRSDSLASVRRTRQASPGAPTHCSSRCRRTGPLPHTTPSRIRTARSFLWGRHP